MEKQHDKLGIGPKTPPPVKPVAEGPVRLAAISGGNEGVMVETSQEYLDKHKAINEAYEFLNQVADKNTLAEAMPGVAIHQGRAYANSSGHIMLDPFTDASTVVHEYAHHIEYKLSREGRAKLNEFITKRKGKEEVSRIYTSAELADEKGYKDDFLKAVKAVYPERGETANSTRAHYAGKTYGDNVQGPTEIITIGAEMLFQDPGAFAKADPEWFDLVEGVISGRIR